MLCIETAAQREQTLHFRNGLRDQSADWSRNDRFWGRFYCFTEGFSFSAMTHRRMVSTMSGRV